MGRPSRTVAFEEQGISVVPQAATPIAYRIPEAARIVGVSDDKLRQMLATGEIVGRKIGSAVVITREEISRVIQVRKRQDAKISRSRIAAKRTAEKEIDASPFGTVYVVAAGNYVKIGFTAGLVEDRIKSLQTGAPYRIRLVAKLSAHQSQEHLLHARFAALRTAGEWFHRKGEVAAWINAGCPK